jgi:nucleoid-associated protein EbfC
MAPIDLEARARELEQLVRAAAAKANTLQEQEHVGTAADGLVTATITGGETRIEIHVLAKRRLERDELGEAILEAVKDAERQASRAIASFLDDATDVPGVGADVRSGVAEALQRIRSQVPGLPM